MQKSKFKIRVLEIVSQIPVGKTMTYKQVVEKAGSPKAYRAVGNILNKAYCQSLIAYRQKHKDIPRSDQLLTISNKLCCHRVIRSDGKVGGYAGGSKKKEKLLKAEGYELSV